MKPFAYYRTVIAEYPDRYKFKQKLVDDINNTPMTAAQREAALARVDAAVTEWFKEAIKPYQEESGRLEQEFWDDCREELGYGDMLTPAGLSALEYYAYEKGHAHGFSSVYDELTSVVNLMKRLRGEFRGFMPEGISK